MGNYTLFQPKSPDFTVGQAVKAEQIFLISKEYSSLLYQYKKVMEVIKMKFKLKSLISIILSIMMVISMIIIAIPANAVVIDSNNSVGTSEYYLWYGINDDDPSNWKSVPMTKSGSSYVATTKSGDQWAWTYFFITNGNSKDSVCWPTSGSSALNKDALSAKQAEAQYRENLHNYHAYLIQVNTANLTYSFSYDGKNTVTVSEDGSTPTSFTINFATGNSGGGRVKAEVNSAEIASGAKYTSSTAVTFKATPADGYQFSGWYSTSDCSGDAVSNVNPYTQTVSSTTNVYAKFTAVSGGFKLVGLSDTTFNYNNGTAFNAEGYVTVTITKADIDGNKHYFQISDGTNIYGVWKDGTFDIKDKTSSTNCYGVNSKSGYNGKFFISDPGKYKIFYKKQDNNNNGGIDVWVEKQSTPVESDEYTLYDYSSNSESPLGKFSKNADDTYSLELRLSAKEYKLFVKDKAGKKYFNQENKFIDGSIILYDYNNLLHTINFTPSTEGTYKFTLTPGTSESQKTVTLSVERISALNSLYISSNLNDDTTVSWTKITDKNSVYSKPVSDGYTFAFSNKADYSSDFATDFSVAEDKTVFCSVTKGTKVYDKETGDSVTTYTVNANAGRTEPTLYVDPATSTVYAIAKYDKTSPENGAINTTSSSKTVTYYFAEYANEKDISKSGDGLRIKYWNNSVVSVDNPNTCGYADVTTPVNVNNSNSIYVNTQELYNVSGTGSDNNQEFKIYSVKLPVWATSFAFVSSDANVIRTNASNPKSEDWASLVLNPNRVYLLFKYDQTTYAKGVVLDESLWTNGGNDNTNQVATKTFKANAVNFKTNYNTIETSDGYFGKENSGFNTRTLKPLYPTAYNHPLYFGYLDGTNNTSSDANSIGSNFKLWDNLAMRTRDEKDGRYYYASVQGLAGNKLSSSKNSNGYSLLYGYDNQTLMPLFDYSNLVKNGLADEGNVHQGLNFPFNQSTFDGVTTYSYDSTTDYNRVIENGDFKVSTGYETATIGDDKGLGYFPFGQGQYGFSTEFDIDFYMTGDGKINGQDIKFNFSGDDDVWVYVDGVLVLDLGGAHKISAGSINFSDMKVYYKSAIKDTDSISSINDSFAATENNVKTVDLKNLFAAYGVDFKNNDASTKHTLQMFYMERGCFDSNCSISFNLPQNSGLRVENDIDLSNVNSAFKADTLKTANGDYFSYTVENALASDEKYNAVNDWNKKFGSLIATIAKSVADDFGNDLSLELPVYNGPLDKDVNRQIDSSTTIKLKSQTTENGTKSNNYLSDITVTPDSFFPLKDVNFSLFDKYAKSDGASTEVIGRTTDNGNLGLLYGQTAQFDSKITPNSLVKISQNDTLKSVDTNSTTIALGSDNGRKASDYYTTTYTVTDTNTKKNGSDLTIGDGHNLNSANSIVAKGDSLSDSDGFYFTNYGDASSNSFAMVVNYTNTVSTGNLKISKALTTEAQSNNFKFTVEFANVFGGSDNVYKEYIDGSLKYTVYDNAGKIVATRYYTDGVYIKATQYAVIEGVPVGTKYRITEQEIGGYELNKIDTPTVSDVKSDLTPNDLGISVSTPNKQSTGTIPTVDKLTSATAVSETAFTYINKFATLTVNFKYYDRKVTSGTVSQIDTTPSTMKYSFDVNPITGMYIGEEGTGTFNPSQYEGEGGTTGFAAVVANAFKSVGSKIGNVVDEYVCFNTQADAIRDMPNQKDYHVKPELVGKDKNGTLVYKLAADPYQLDAVNDAPYYKETLGITDNAAEYFTYHTNCYSEPQSSGDKWVTYYDKSGNVINSDDGLTNADLANVDHIDVWLFNNLKQYTVTAYTASDDIDLINNVANSKTKTITTFYNVRFGEENGHYEKVDEDTFNKLNVDKLMYLKNNDGTPYKDADGNYSVWVTSTGRNTAGEYLDKYGFNGIGYTGSYPVTAPEIEGTKFSHWAYNDNGKYVPITTDIDYGYRVTRDLDVYAVYSKDELNSGLPGVSVIQNTPDHFVNGTTSSTRLNTQMNVYNCPDNDTNIQQAAIVYVMAKNFTEASLTQEQLQQLRTDIADILNQRISNAGKYPLSKVLEIGVDKYSANCFVYDINDNTTSDTTYKSSLTNKNRGQFTTTFTDENLARFKRMFAFAAVKYNFEDASKNPWIVSDNYIDYKATSLGVTE